MTFKHWFIQVFISIDQVFNALLLGYADETLSSRAWRMWFKKKPLGLFFKPIIDILFIWQSGKMDHCKRAYEKEKQRVTMPPEFRL